MLETYDLLPELKHDLGDIFKHELDQILLFYKDEKVWCKLDFSKSSSFESEEIDLTFITAYSEPVFKTEYSLDGNARQFLNLDNLTFLMAIGVVFTEVGVEKMIGE